MPLFHASFKGRRTTEFGKPLRRIQVLLPCTSIWRVKEKLEERYEFITGICVTNIDATQDNPMFEIA
jgi:hypothetical protein